MIAVAVVLLGLLGVGVVAAHAPRLAALHAPVGEAPEDAATR